MKFDGCQKVNKIQIPDDKTEKIAKRGTDRNQCEPGGR